MERPFTGSIKCHAAAEAAISAAAELPYSCKVNVNNELPEATETYWTPPTLYVIGEATICPPRYRFHSSSPLVASSA